MKNVFIYGMSGAGKDTAANYLRDTLGYLKLRIAGTIKQYIFETYGFKNQEEFENAKRTNPEIRKAHNIVGRLIDNEGLEHTGQAGSLNRLDQLIARTSLEFEIHYNMSDKPLCIVDVRTKDEAEKCLKAGFIGIFLDRRAQEYADRTHKTEQDMFINGELMSLVKNYQEQSILIFNSDTDIIFKREILDKTFNDIPSAHLIATNGKPEQLQQVCRIMAESDFNPELYSERLRKYFKES